MDSQAHFAATTDLYGHFGQIVQCLDCRLIYSSQRLSDQKLTELYRNQADLHYADEDTSRSINAYFCLNTILEHRRSGKLLEIGSAAGYFLNAARLHFDCCGIELCQGAAEYSRKQLNLDVKSCRIEEAGFADQTFDVVVMVDVIEHQLTALLEFANVLLKAAD